MDVDALLLELYGRVEAHVVGAVADLDAAGLAAAPGPGANHIGWLVWHLTRVEDGHVAELLDVDQLYVTGSWAERLGMPADPEDSGYGHTEEQVAAVKPGGPDLLLDYYRAVNARTRGYLAGLSPADLDRIVDERWDPPVTLGVRLVSIVDDQIQHAGQAKYLRGLLGR